MKKFLVGIGVVGLIVVFFHYKPLFVSFFKISPQHRIDPNNLVVDFAVGGEKAVFNNKPLLVPSNLASELKRTDVLGDSSLEKRIEVNLTNQLLQAYEGDRLVYSFLISSGKWGRTPTGKFNIWVKLRSTKMEGGSKALRTYYYLPGVPYVMYFYNDEIPKHRGYGLHGTYWHDNFGHPMSHGCINMKIEEIALLYQWAHPELGENSSVYASADNPGTEIYIYGEAPWE